MWTRVELQTFILTSCIGLIQLVCVDVPSGTEAVVGKDMKLSCISCMKREEVKAKTLVEWFYLQNTELSSTVTRTLIYKFEVDHPVALPGPFLGRVLWDGSQDLQDLSISIRNVTFNDSGVYECHVFRQFEFDFFSPSISIVKNISMKVKEEATVDSAAIYSEIMMYLLLVFLTLWLLVEMIYCYRKISRTDKQAQDTATNYLSVPSEQKENPTAAISE